MSADTSRGGIAGVARTVVRLPLLVLRFVLAVVFSRGPLAAGLAALTTALLVLYFSLLAAIQPAAHGEELAIGELRLLATSGEVVEATFYEDDDRVVLERADGEVAWAAYPGDGAEADDLVDSLIERGAEVRIDQQTGKVLVRFVVQFLLPLIILASLFGVVFILVSGKGAGGGAASEFAAFSSLRGARKPAPTRATTFADVAGNAEALIELQEVVDFLKEPERFAHMGAQAPKGVLLTGPPGTGKTLLARAVAGEAGVPFFSLSGSEFVESLVGVGAARVRDLFRQAQEEAPAIIFIDEIDAAGRKRGAGTGQGNDEREQTLNQMLVEMDGFSSGLGIVVIAATNRPDILDPALLRPGRFDRQIVVDTPDVAGRQAILRLYAAGRPLTPDADLERLARQTPGFSGAELSSLINEASLLAVRDGREQINQHDLEEAIDRVISGPARRGHVLTDAERRLVAYHEVGHAIVAQSVGMHASVQKLSIVARGRSLGHTTTYDLSDRLVLSRSDLVRQLATLLGGAAVEHLVFGEVSTGSENDLRQATELARDMVMAYGMGEAIGRVALAQRSGGDVFLGGEAAQVQGAAPATLEAIDHEVRAILEWTESHARSVLARHKPLVEQLTAILIDRETLSGPELDRALSTVQLMPPPTMRLTGRPDGAGANRTDRRPIHAGRSDE